MCGNLNPPKPSFLSSLSLFLSIPPSLFTVPSLPLSGSSSSQLCSSCSRSCLSPSIPYALTRLDLKARPVLPCYAVPYSGSPPSRPAPPSLPTYQHLFHQSSLDPGPSDFGRSTSALRLNSNQRSRPPLSNCVDFAFLSDSTHRRSSEPLQGRPSARPHDPLLLPTLCPRHRIAFHDTSGKPPSPRQDQSIAPWAETRCLCRPSEVPNGRCTPGRFHPPKHSVAFRQPCCANLLLCDSGHIDFLVTPATTRDAPRWPGNLISSGAVIPNTSEY